MHYADPGKLALMRQIKALLDPDGLMNPGKVLAYFACAVRHRSIEE